MDEGDGREVFNRRYNDAGAARGVEESAAGYEIRQHWMPSWEKYGVSAVFENDRHNYKRTYRLRGYKRDDENGIMYLGDGAWAVETRTVPAPGTAWWLEKAEGRNHVWEANLRANETATIRAVDIDGRQFDKVELSTPRTKPVD